MDSRGKTFFRTKFFNKLEIYETFLPATKQVPIHSLLPSQTIVLYFLAVLQNIFSCCANIEQINN